MAAHHGQRGGTRARRGAAEEARLTPKEREVLTLMLRRYTNAEISSELYISLYTAKNHVSSILRKLGLKSRRDLV